MIANVIHCLTVGRSSRVGPKSRLRAGTSLACLAVLTIGCHGAQLPEVRIPKEDSMSSNGDHPSIGHDVRTASPNAGPAHGPAGIRRTVLGTEPLEGTPGWEIRMLLIEYDPGVVAEPHTHPVPGIGYVLEGAFESSWGEGGGEVTVKHQGESFVDFPHQRHLFRNASSTERLRFVIAYAIPKGMATLAPSP
jgi:quercetin dioxygenase-like cupin family protein